MKFVVHCLDFKDALPKRIENYEKHKSYLSSGTVKTIISGPLLTDGDGSMIGSLFIFEADNKEEIINFNKNDPFSIAGVWDRVEIHSFNLRVDNRS